jgi:hypothetical protein
MDPRSRQMGRRTKAHEVAHEVEANGLPCEPCPVCAEPLEFYWEQCPVCLLQVQQCPSVDCAGCSRQGRVASLTRGISATSCVFVPSGPELAADGWPTSVDTTANTSDQCAHAVARVCLRALETQERWRICPDCKLPAAATASVGGDALTAFRVTLSAVRQQQKRARQQQQSHRKRACASLPPHMLECPCCARLKAPLLYFCSAACALRKLHLPASLLPPVSPALSSPSVQILRDTCEADRSHLLTDSLRRQYDRDGHLFLPSLLLPSQVGMW